MDYEEMDYKGLAPEYKAELLKFRETLENKLTTLVSEGREQSREYNLTHRFYSAITDPSNLRQYHPKHGKMMIPISAFWESYREQMCELHKQ